MRKSKTVLNIQLSQLIFEQIEVHRRLYFQCTDIEEKIYLLGKIQDLALDLKLDLERQRKK